MLATSALKLLLVLLALHNSLLSYFQTVEGDFKVVTGAVTICACDHSPRGLTPSAHLGDGQVNLNPGLSDQSKTVCKRAR